MNGPTYCCATDQNWPSLYCYYLLVGVNHTVWNSQSMKITIFLSVLSIYFWSRSFVLERFTFLNLFCWWTNLFLLVCESDSINIALFMISNWIDKLNLFQFYIQSDRIIYLSIRIGFQLFFHIFEWVFSQLGTLMVLIGGVWGVILLSDELWA